MIDSLHFDTLIELAAQLIERADVEVSPLISGTFPIEESLIAFTLA